MSRSSSIGFDSEGVDEEDWFFGYTPESLLSPVLLMVFSFVLSLRDYIPYRGIIFGEDTLLPPLRL